AGVHFSAPRLALISNLSGRPADETVATPSYWIRHIRQAVRFSGGIETLRSLGYDTFLEIGPAPVLSGLGRKCVGTGEGTWLPSLRKGRDDWEQMLESLETLYVNGADVDWNGFDRGFSRRKVSLPSYPFQ